MAAEYDTLAPVYDFLLPEALVTPEGTADAFAPYLEPLGPGARVLDCACGAGQLAVGLALRGFAVSASDLSPEMVARTRALAAERGVAVDAATCAWDDLGRHGWPPFDAVMCVGNSLAHAAGRDGRRRALRAMAGLVGPGGRLVLTSRNWELVRAAGSRIDVAGEVTVRDGARGLVVYGWSLAPGWDDTHHLEIAVALLDDAGPRVTTHRERLTFWPFRHEDLDADLEAAGLTRAESTYDPAVARYLVSAERVSAARPGSPARTP